MNQRRGLVAVGAGCAVAFVLFIATGPRLPGAAVTDHIASQLRGGDAACQGTTSNTCVPNSGAPCGTSTYYTYLENGYVAKLSADTVSCQVGSTCTSCARSLQNCAN